VQTKILRSGLELAIDTLGGKTFQVKIKYPFGNAQVIPTIQTPNPEATKEANANRDRNAFRLKLLAEAKEVQITGFKPPLGNVITLSDANNTGISAAININQRGIMYYEAVIPFSTFYKNELTPSDSNRVFNYQLKIDPVTKSENEMLKGGRAKIGGMHEGSNHSDMAGAPHDRMHGGMRGGGGGMRGNSVGMNGYNPTGYQRGVTMAETTKTTVKLKLAYRP
jgi:hypothetical protein